LTLFLLLILFIIIPKDEYMDMYINSLASIFLTYIFCGTVLDDWLTLELSRL
jgi:hypothetical protein